MGLYIWQPLRSVRACSFFDSGILSTTVRKLLSRGFVNRGVLDAASGGESSSKESLTASLRIRSACQKSYACLFHP